MGHMLSVVGVELGVLVVDRATVFTKSNRDRIMIRGMVGFARKDDTFSRDIELMHESLITECLDDTIEGREIHTMLSLSYEVFFEF